MYAVLFFNKNSFQLKSNILNIRDLTQISESVINHENYNEYNKNMYIYNTKKKLEKKKNRMTFSLNI